MKKLILPEDPQTVVQGLVAEKQKEEMWCWAAVSRILLSSKVQNLPSQCEIVFTTKIEIVVAQSPLLVYRRPFAVRL